MPPKKQDAPIWSNDNEVMEPICRSPGVIMLGHVCLG